MASFVLLAALAIACGGKDDEKRSTKRSTDDRSDRDDERDREERRRAREAREAREVKEAEEEARARAARRGAAVAIVMSGWEVWIGNDKEVPAITEGAPDRYPGALISLREAWSKLQFSRLPQGTQAMLVTYADKPTIRVPMGPVANLTPAAFGTQKDYFGVTGSEMVSGVRIALHELRKVQVGKRVVIVIGDGVDTDLDMAKGQLMDLKKQVAADGIEVYAIVYKTRLSSDLTVISALTDRVTTVSTAENIAAALHPLLEHLDKPAP